MNNKKFSNIDMDPRDTLVVAEIESILWTETHNSIIRRPVQAKMRTSPIILER